MISDKLSSNELMISKLTADKFGIEEGDDITLYFQINNIQRIPNVRSYTIKYIFDTDFTDFDNNYIIGNAKSLQSIFKWGFNDYSIIEISTRNNSKIMDIESSISELESIERNNLSVKSIESKLFISVEEHNVIGGLGSAIAEIMAEYNKKPKHIMLGINDFYEKGGSYEYLLNKYGLNKEKIINTAISNLK